MHFIFPVIFDRPGATPPRPCARSCSPPLALQALADSHTAMQVLRPHMRRRHIRRTMCVAGICGPHMRRTMCGAGICGPHMRRTMCGAGICDAGIYGPICGAGTCGTDAIRQERCVRWKLCPHALGTYSIAASLAKKTVLFFGSNTHVRYAGSSGYSYPG